MKSYKDFKQEIAEVAAPKAKAQKHFHAAHGVKKKDHVDYPEHQFKATHGKDATKKASYHDDEDVEAYKAHQPGHTPSSVHRKGESDDGSSSMEDDLNAVRVYEATQVAGIFSSNPLRVAKAVGKLRRMMDSPIPAKEAADKLYDVAFDSKLFDQIKAFAAKDPNVDVRPVIRKRMKELGIKGF